MANQPIPRKGVAYTLVFPIMDNDGDLVTGAAGLDSEVSKDKGTYADCTNESTEIATSSGTYYLDLTATEMNADIVSVIIKTSTANAKTTPITLYPYGSTSGTEAGSGTGLDNTLAGLRRLLRIRLNDLTSDGDPGGNYTTEALDVFINLAYRETVRKSKCKKVTNTLTFVAGTAEYDGTDIFEGLELVKSAANAAPLSHIPNERAMSLTDNDWRNAANGTPLYWWQSRGGYITVQPKPDATAASASWLYTGYAYPAALTNDAHEPVDLPDGDAVQVLLDRAECHARRARPTHANNVGLADKLEANWQAACADIRKSVLAEGG
jgi:hypothetical protein